MEYIKKHENEIFFAATLGIIVVLWTVMVIQPPAAPMVLPFLPSSIIVLAAAFPVSALLLAAVNMMVLIIIGSAGICNIGCCIATAAAGLIGAAIFVYRKTHRTANKFSDENVLLSEMRHRMKNDFQFISSLFSLESRKITDEESRKVFAGCQERVYALSCVQDFLTCRGKGEVDFPRYVSQLILRLRDSQISPAGWVEMTVKIDKVSMTVKEAETCGLIINEAVTNSLKYAFPDGYEKKPHIIVMCRYLPGNIIRLCVRDNGKGIDNTARKNECLGLDLMKILAEDRLNGKFGLGQENGTNLFTEFTSSLSNNT